jgi:hypothetical protein
VDPAGGPPSPAGVRPDDPHAALLDLLYHEVGSDRGLYALLVRRGEMETLVPADVVERAR